PRTRRRAGWAVGIAQSAAGGRASRPECHAGSCRCRQPKRFARGTPLGPGGRRFARAPARAAAPATRLARHRVAAGDTGRAGPRTLGNGRARPPSAEQALDALNATAHALVRTAQRVSGAQSGSGFQEALEQLARMAQDQQGMNGAAQGLLPMMGLGGEAVMQRVRELAARQRALAEQLERLQAEGEAGAAGALAQEARELARQLEAGRLD